MPTLAGSVYLGTDLVSSTAPSADAYVRPADWLALPAVTAGTQKIVGLHSVYPHDSNFVAFQCANAYTVDWGDGTASENIAANVTAQHNYVFTNLSSTTLTAGGYRQAIITVTPQAANNLTKLDLYIKHSQSGLVSMYATGWLDIRMAGTLITTLQFQAITPTTVVHTNLEQFEYVGASGLSSWSSKFYQTNLQSIILNTSAITNFTNMFNSCVALKTVVLSSTSSGTIFSAMFNNCTALKTVPLFDTSHGTAFDGMFASNTSLVTIPLFDTHLGTDFTSTFNGCSALTTVPLLDTSKATTTGNMFMNCKNLRTIPLLNTGLVVGFSDMFSGCVALETVPALNVTTGGFFSTMFNGCVSLSSAPLSGTKANISYASCSLGPVALDAIYTNLASGVSAKSVTVTGNWGIASDTPSIATVKGWTVTGS